MIQKLYKYRSVHTVPGDTTNPLITLSDILVVAFGKNTGQNLKMNLKCYVKHTWATAPQDTSEKINPRSLHKSFEQRRLVKRIGEYKKKLKKFQKNQKKVDIR